MTQLHETTGSDWDPMARVFKTATISISNHAIDAMLERANAVAPFREAVGIHDNGCGPGPIMRALIEQHSNDIPAGCALSASDFAPGMVGQLERSRIEAVAGAEREGKHTQSSSSTSSSSKAAAWSRLQISVQDATALTGMGDGIYSHMFAGWVYFLTADPQKCLTESLRVLAPGGVLACSSWKGSEWMRIAEDAVARIRGEAEEPPQMLPTAWRSGAGLRGELERAGFGEVECVEVEVQLRFDTYEALLEVLLTKMPHMVHLTESWTDEERARLREVMLKEVKEVSPTQPGSMTGVALVAVGRK